MHRIPRLSRLLLLVFLFVGVSCREDPAGVEVDPMKQGLEALHERKDPAGAIPHFRKVLETQPEHYGANYQLAVALDRTGKSSEARPYWEKVLKMAEGYGDQETAGTAKQRLAPPPTDKHGMLMQSGLNLLYELERPEDAAGEFRKILADNPDHYGATYQLATALDRANRRDEARPLWEKTLRWAEEYKDETTESTARTRLAQP